MGFRVAMVVLAALVYAAWIHAQRRDCAGAFERDIARLRVYTADLRGEFYACAFDALAEGACGIAPADAAATTAATGTASVTATTAVQQRTITAHTRGAFCALVDRLPDPLGALGVGAASVVDVVVSRTRLNEHDAALAAFRAQCDCAGAWWAPWWRTPANYDHKVSYEFVRTGLRTDALRAELRRAAPFYARFGGAIDTWVESVARPGGGDQMMSDHGMLWRDERRHVAMIVRYILVVYRAAAPTQATPAAAAAATARPYAALLWGGSGGSGGDGDSDSDGLGTFTLCMSEVQVTTWPAGDCDCARDHGLHQRLRETVDAKLKKHFADSASHTIRAIPDAFDEQPATSVLPRAQLPPSPPLPRPPPDAMDTL